MARTLTGGSAAGAGAQLGNPLMRSGAAWRRILATSPLHPLPRSFPHMLITDRPYVDVDALRERLTGEVVGPGDAHWDRARQAWNLALDQRPLAVAFPVTDADVVAVVDYA